MTAALDALAYRWLSRHPLVTVERWYGVPGIGPYWLGILRCRRSDAYWFFRR